MAKKRIEILVVEDREENKRAAQEYFNTREEVHADFATSYDEAMQKLESKAYHGAILGAKTEKLGTELGKQLEKSFTPYVFLSGGYFHHDRPMAKVFLDEFCARKNIGKTVEDKTKSNAWKSAYEALMETYPDLDGFIAAKERLKKVRNA